MPARKRLVLSFRHAIDCQSPQAFDYVSHAAISTATHDLQANVMDKKGQMQGAIGIVWGSGIQYATSGKSNGKEGKRKMQCTLRLCSAS